MYDVVAYVRSEPLHIQQSREGWRLERETVACVTNDLPGHFLCSGQ